MQARSLLLKSGEWFQPTPHDVRTINPSTSCFWGIPFKAGVELISGVWLVLVEFFPWEFLVHVSGVNWSSGTFQRCFAGGRMPILNMVVAL